MTCTLQEFGRAVISQMDEQDLKKLIVCLDELYDIAAEEIEKRSMRNRKEDNMGKIFKNMIPYWKPLILVLLLLFVQAWCDLSLPAYTSDIIDVGIQNQGIKHILPEALTPEEYEKAELLMTDEETASWEESYALNGSVYERNVTGEERLEELDDTFLVPLLMNYQMSAMEESTFKKLMAEQMHTDESALDGMTIEQIGASMGVELKTFEKETANEDGIRRQSPVMV